MTDLDIVNDAIIEVEAKALKAYKYRKYTMFGYYKAIAVYLRKLARQMKD